MTTWTAEIMTDPMRDHKLHVELMEGGIYRARLYKDDLGKVQLWVYKGTETTIPAEWLLGIIQRFSEEPSVT